MHIGTRLWSSGVTGYENCLTDTSARDICIVPVFVRIGTGSGNRNEGRGVVQAQVRNQAGEKGLDTGTQEGLGISAWRPLIYP